MQHDTTALDTAEVTTLHRVDETSFVDDRTDACPMIFIIIAHKIVNVRHDDFACIIAIIRGITPVLTGIERLLARRQVIELLVRHASRQIVIIGAIVGDVQFAVTIDKGKVAVAIETSDTTATHADEVAAVDVDH